MSHIEQKPSNLPESFDNIPAIDDDDQGLKNCESFCTVLIKKSIFFSCDRRQRPPDEQHVQWIGIKIHGLN